MCIRDRLFTVSALSLALAGVSTSCSNEIEPQPGNDGTVTFTVQLPEGTATRAFADGTTATKLSYAVYKKGETTPISGMVVDGVNAIDMEGKSAIVTLQLVNGNAYDIIFWAESEAVHNATENKPYTITWEGQALDVNYTGTTVNDDSRDAFYIKKSVTVNGPIAETVSLRRPFAQVNFGSDDVTAPAVLEAFGDPVAYKNTVTTKVYTQMNLGTGEVSNQIDYTFLAGPSALGETFPVEGDKYSYVSMCYLLVPNKKELADVTFTLYDNNDVQRNQVVVTNAPIQRNYRTNVYGSLFTSTTEYNVVIEPEFNSANNNIEIWDGISKKMPELVDNEYRVTEPAELAGLAEMVKKGDTFAGKTITLTKSFDMGGNTFAGFGDKNHPFKGTLDGNGHTISNFNTTGSGFQSDYATGLVPILDKDGVVKNLTIERGVIGRLYDGKDGKKYVYGNIVGAVAGYCNGRIENVTVNNCTIYGFGKVGGLAGHDFYQPTSSYVNCKVTNSVISGTYNSACLVGLSDRDLDLTSCTEENNTLETGPYPADGDWITMYQWITVERTKAVDINGGGRKPVMVEGNFTPIGSTYFATGAKYYNRYDLDNSNNGLYITIDGIQHEIDGYPVNSPEGPERVD